MQTQISSAEQQKRRLFTRILLPVATVTILAIALAGLSLLWAVQKSDDVSVGRQLRTTEHSIRAVIGELAQQQEMVAVWNDTVQQVRKPELDYDWVDANLGPWLHKTFGHDQVFILDDRDEPIDTVIDGQRVPADAYDRVRSSLAPLVAAVRSQSDPSHQAHIAQLTAQSYLTSGRAVMDAHLVEVLERPAAVSVMKIVTESDDVVQEPGSEFLLASIRFLDGSFLKGVAEKNLIEDLRFSRSNTPNAGEISIPLNADSGALFGYFIWHPELPGTRILQILGPSTALVCLLLIAVMALLVRSLWRSVSKLQATVTELHISEAHAQHLAYHDVLTGLPNRALCNDRLDQALARARHGARLALLMIDLDRFKHVNDTLGHQAGDNLIREFAVRLPGLMRGTDTVARLGGDEFAVIITDVQNKSDIEALCRRILAAVREPFDLQGSQAYVGASIGVAFAPDASLDRIDLVRKADIALYQAKNEGRDCYRCFEPFMDETIKSRASIEEDLREALVTGKGLKVEFQPQVAVAGYPVIGLEALVRWEHPTRGPLSPDAFIPIAEETGLIVPLGEMVLRRACAVSRKWPELIIAVNLSPAQFHSSHFVDRVIGIVRENGVDPGRIELEVTEGVLLGDRLTRTILRRLRKAGFRIALDDFGSGHSSLSYLRQYEVDKIKIDRSFVQNLGQQTDMDSAAIVTAITSLGRTIGLKVTAEGVETEDQRRFLAGSGCTELQGYLFARAVPEERIAELMSAKFAPAKPR